jgi:hypothetical protein
MSVSRADGPGGEVSYDDVEVQRARTVCKAPGGLAGDTSEKIQLDNYDPAGGLARDEAAELIAYRADYEVRMNEPGGALEDLEGLITMWQWGTADEEKMGSIGPFSTSSNGFDYDAWNEGGHEDVFDFGQGRVMGPWEDDTNGNGGGEFGTVAKYSVNYRDLFERGPILTRLDDLSTWNFMQTKGTYSAEIESTYILTSYWNVFETGGPTY